MINPLELNLRRQFNPSEKNDTYKKIFTSVSSHAHLEKDTRWVQLCANLLPGIKYLNILKPLEKIIIEGAPGFLNPYPCTDKKWNSPLSSLVLLCGALSLTPNFCAAGCVTQPEGSFKDSGKITGTEQKEYFSVVYYSCFAHNLE